jgi:hypothetical protein
VVLEPLGLHFNASRKDVLACIFPHILTLVTSRIESKRKSVFLLFLFRLQLNQRYKLRVDAMLAAYAEKISIAHNEIPEGASS